MPEALFTAPDLHVAPVTNESAFLVIARKGQAPALREKLHAVLGAEPPTQLGCVDAGRHTIIAAAPDSWLVFERGSTDASAPLASACAGLGSVFDQTGAYLRWRLTGARAVDVLQKGAFLDLAAFGPGWAATTQIAHVGVILWRPSTEAAFELAVWRSMGDSLLHWLVTAAKP